MKIALLLLPVFVFATSLDQILSLVHTSEPSLIWDENLNQERLRLDKATKEYLPSLSIAGGYKYTSKERFIITPKESLSAMARVEFLLYDGGAREANIASLTHIKDAAFYESKDGKNLLAYNAVKLYFSYKSIEGIIKAKKAQSKFLSFALNRLQIYHKSGLAPLDELKMIEANLELSKADLISYEARLKEVKNAIYLLISKQITPSGTSTLMMPQFDMTAQNPLVASAELKSAAASNGVDAARGEYLPKIYLSDTYSFYKNNFDFDDDIPANYKGFAKRVGDKVFDKYSQNNQFMIGLEWKFFDFGARGKGVEIKEADAMKAALALRYKKREIEVNLQNIKDEILSKHELVKASSLRAKAALIGFEATRKKYESGLVLYTQFLQSLSENFSATADFIAAKDEFEIAKAHYFYMQGVDIKTKVIR